MTSGMPAQQLQLHTMTAFKVSRACAAACLHATAPAATRPAATAATGLDAALEVQARLQPLKHRHFERRTLYLAQQIKEVRRPPFCPDQLCVSGMARPGRALGASNRPRGRVSRNP